MFVKIYITSSQGLLPFHIPGFLPWGGARDQNLGHIYIVSSAFVSCKLLLKTVGLTSVILIVFIFRSIIETYISWYSGFGFLNMI